MMHGQKNIKSVCGIEVTNACVKLLYIHINMFF